jgi:Tol biopolymer transport system component
LTAGAIGALGLQDGNVGMMSFSGAHWSDGDHVMVARKDDVSGTPALVWIDLEAADAAQGTGFGVLARTGDAHGAWAPSWSHDGEQIVYTSADIDALGWKLSGGNADLHVVDYGDRKGGSAKPLEGASLATRAEYYPAYSPDDQLVAFAGVEGTPNSLYNNAQAELFVIPAKGGAAVRLAANDPPECGGTRSPGVTNSWPKWSPQAISTGGKTYYWVTFSSTRDGLPQLYVAGIVVEGGTVHTYPALYLWNQPPDESNHTPAWDVFEIPVPPVIR